MLGPRSLDSETKKPGLMGRLVEAMGVQHFCVGKVFGENCNVDAC